MKNGNYDISTVPGNGYLVLPLSMTRLANAQSASEVYKFLTFFDSKIKHISLDVVLLYTNGLYMNSEESSTEIRKKMLNQVTQHKNEFLGLLLKERKYVPQAFHFLPWDYAVINADEFSENKDILLKTFKKSEEFADIIHKDLQTAQRSQSEANILFLIEEIVVTHLLLQKKIPLPHTLATNDGWRLICYPGDPIQSLVYVHNHHLLHQRTDLQEQHSLFAHSLYNWEKKVLIDFEQIKL